MQQPVLGFLDELEAVFLPRRSRFLLPNHACLSHVPLIAARQIHVQDIILQSCGWGGAEESPCTDVLRGYNFRFEIIEFVSLDELKCHSEWNSRMYPSV